MGFVKRLARQLAQDLVKDLRDSPTNRGEGRRLWREVFGTVKEDGSTLDQPVRGTRKLDSLGAASAPNQIATTRLLQALRSMAPGGWSDDRTEQTRHDSGLVYLANHRKGELLYEGEFQVFRKDPNHPKGKRPVTEDDPPQGGRPVRPYELVDLLQKPNRRDCFGDLMYSWNQQMDLTGKALTWMVPNRLGVPMELYVIPTSQAIPQPAVNPDYPDGYYRIQPIYPYGPFSSYPTPNSAVGAAVPAQWMMEFQYNHPFLRYDGLSPLTALRLQIDSAESIERSRWYKMKRDVSPNAVLEMEDYEGDAPLPEEEIARLHAEFENLHMGPENLGRLLVIAGGGKISPFGNTPQEMAYKESWEQIVGFVMAALGITKPAAGMTDASSYSTLFASLKQLYWLTLSPWCYRVGSKLTRNLAPFFGDDLIVEVRCKRIDDHEVKLSRLDKAISGKAITKNELREELELPLTNEDWGGDMAGDPSPMEQEQQEQAQQAQQQPGQEMGPMMGQDPQEVQDPAEAARPSPGNLSAGALGPRMGTVADGKGYYGAIRKMLANDRKVKASRKVLPTPFRNGRAKELNGNGRH